MASPEFTEMMSDMTMFFALTENRFMVTGWADWRQLSMTRTW